MVNIYDGHKVSLTKQNFRTLPDVLIANKLEDVLSNLGGIDEPQAKKMLVVDSDGNVPTVWDDAKKISNDAVKLSVLVSIIFSHELLINYFKESTSNKEGVLIKGSSVNDKVYTNISRFLVDAGIAEETNPSSINYDFKPLFEVDKLLLHKSV